MLTSADCGRLLAFRIYREEGEVGDTEIGRTSLATKVLAVGEPGITSRDDHIICVERGEEEAHGEP